MRDYAQQSYGPRALQSMVYSLQPHVLVQGVDCGQSWGGLRCRASPVRDHRKLKAFQLADNLVMEVYRSTGGFPSYEQFGLTSQLRRAALSAASNIVEGCARHSEKDYLHFLDMAYGSAREVDYQLSVAFRLGYLKEETYKKLKARSVETGKVLNGLIRRLRHQGKKPTAYSLKPTACRP